MSIYQQYKTKTRSALQKDLKKKNIHQAPSLDKVVVSVGIGSLATRKGVKDFSDIEKNLAAITGQKPVTMKSKKAISNFKLRENMPVMLKVTLRREKAYEFLDKLTKVVMPRVRDFVGLSAKSFDPNNNYNIGLTSQAIFPEILGDDANAMMGIQVNIVTNAATKEDAIAMMKALGFIFLEK
ncbi:50S ribosomal protein L5 [Patescibacteria group bacterium]|nr:50S ribosomal protein L5 [Patescibacteria group bacterium]